MNGAPSQLRSIRRRRLVGLGHQEEEGKNREGNGSEPADECPDLHSNPEETHHQKENKENAPTLAPWFPLEVKNREKKGEHKRGENKMSGHSLPATPTRSTRVCLGHTGIILETVIKPTTSGEERPEEESEKKIGEKTFKEKVFIDYIMIPVPKIEPTPKRIRPIPRLELLRSK